MFINPAEGQLQQTMFLAPIASQQSGFIAPSNPTLGTNGTIDGAYVDVTISAVDVTKSVVVFEGHYGEYPYYIGLAGTSVDGTYAEPMARLTSSTNVRISSLYQNSGWYFTGQWRVVEFG